MTTDPLYPCITRLKMNPHSQAVQRSRAKRRRIFGPTRSIQGRRIQALAEAFAEPHGGLDAMTEAARQVCRRAASLAFELERIEACQRRGEAIDVERLVTYSNALARLLGRLVWLNETTRPAPRTLAEALGEQN